MAIWAIFFGVCSRMRRACAGRTILLIRRLLASTGIPFATRSCERSRGAVIGDNIGIGHRPHTAGLFSYGWAVFFFLTPKRFDT